MNVTDHDPDAVLSRPDSADAVLSRPDGADAVLSRPDSADAVLSRPDSADAVLSRPDGAGAVRDLGWRYLLGQLRTSVPVDGLAEALRVAERALAVCGPDADGHLRVDLRPQRVTLSLQAAAVAAATWRDVELAGRITAAVGELGLATGPAVGGVDGRSVQVVEIAIDALDIAAVRPFWKAILGHVDEPGHTGPRDPLVDPLGQSPAIWFQQMDAPRPQRNRIHFDIAVPEDEVEHRGRWRSLRVAG